MFKSQFSKKLIEDHASVTGLRNQCNEPYWRGEDAYKIETAEDLFYTSYELIKSSKSDYIGEFFIKYWYLIAQRVPTLHALEILLGSAYGRP